MQAIPGRSKDMSENYEDVLKYLKTRIDYNHERYGQSYLEKAYYWMFKRLMGEVVELEQAFGTRYPIDLVAVANEACDVAIVALLIADKAMKGHRE